MNATIVSEINNRFSCLIECRDCQNFHEQKLASILAQKKNPKEDFRAIRNEWFGNWNSKGQRGP